MQDGRSPHALKYVKTGANLAKIGECDRKILNFVKLY